MNSDEKLTDAELVEIMSRLNIMPVDKRRVNKWLIETLRGLDYVSRGRLVRLMRALQAEQHCIRGSYYKESLYRFISLIDQAEKAVQEDEFTSRLLTASSQLPREKRKALLEFAEQQTR